MNSSKGKNTRLEHICTVFKALKERNSENKSQIDAPEKNIHLRNRQNVQTPISDSTLKVFLKLHASNLLDFSLPLLIHFDQNHHSNLTSP